MCMSCRKSKAFSLDEVQGEECFFCQMVTSDGQEVAEDEEMEVFWTYMGEARRGEVVLVNKSEVLTARISAFRVPFFVDKEEAESSSVGFTHRCLSFKMPPRTFAVWIGGVGGLHLSGCVSLYKIGIKPAKITAGGEGGDTGGRD